MESIMLNGYPLLSILVFLPLAGCLLLIPVWQREKRVRQVAIGVALLELALVGWLLAVTPPASTGATGLPGFFLHEDAAWIGRFGIRYTLGMDGVSLLMVLLTAFISVIAMLTSWRGVKERVALHYLLIL